MHTLSFTAMISVVIKTLTDGPHVNSMYLCCCNILYATKLIIIDMGSIRPGFSNATGDVQTKQDIPVSIHTVSVE